MPLTGPVENDAGCRPPISSRARRALVFVLLGPVLGVLAAWSIVTVAIGAYFDPYGFPIVFFFSLAVCAVAGPADGALAYVVPIWLRAPLTAIVGAAAAVGLGLYLWFQLGNPAIPPSLHQQIPIAMIGALSMGACSLLAHDYRRSNVDPAESKQEGSIAC